jgi:dCTP deaminase
MAFWSGETLALRLPSLITNFQPGRIDCAAYTLTVGVDAFITEDEVIVGEPRKGVRFTLGPGESFKIPPGQFAFLTTEEVISVPADALAFISMKATYKFKGLVNVSGFHVDPGWKGPLVFSVYNAGPAAVHLRQGLELFLIWFSSLDQSTKMVYQPKPGKVGLRDELMSNMSGQVFSPMNLGRQLSDVKDKQVELVHELASFKKVVY